MSGKNRDIQEKFRWFLAHSIHPPFRFQLARRREGRVDRSLNFVIITIEEHFAVAVTAFGFHPVDRLVGVTVREMLMKYTSRVFTIVVAVPGQAPRVDVGLRGDYTVRQLPPGRSD